MTFGQVTPACGLSCCVGSPGAGRWLKWSLDFQPLERVQSKAGGSAQTVLLYSLAIPLSIHFVSYRVDKGGTRRDTHIKNLWVAHNNLARTRLGRLIC